MTKPNETCRVAPEKLIRGRNSRIVKAVDYDAKVLNLAVSIAKEGQLVPVAAHKEDRGTVLDDGFTRVDAIELYRNGFEAVDPEDGEKRFFHDKDAKVWVALDREVTSEEQAFVKSIDRNHQRNDTTDVQEALAQQVLREEYKWNDSRIARHYGYTNSNRVAALKTLLTLPQWVVDKVHEGKFALYAALDTKGLEDGVRQQVVEKATDENGNVDGAKVRNLIRDLLSTGDEQASESLALDAEVQSEEKTPESSETPAEEPLPATAVSTRPPAIKRNAKNFLDLAKNFYSYRDYGPEVKKLVAVLAEWFNGTKQDRGLFKALDDVQKAIGEPPPWTEENQA